MERLTTLVTGGAGFIGSHIVNALVERGHRVRVLDALVEQVHGAAGGPPPRLNPEAEFVRGDVCDAETLERARDLFGYGPRVTLEEGVPELLAWVREQKATDQVTRATAELERHQLVR